MPQFNYKGRDKDGRSRSGQRFSFTADNLSAELINEGIFPTNITLSKPENRILDKIQDWLQGSTLLTEELSIFARQMQLLHAASVPMVTALKQLATHTRSRRLANALAGCIDHIEKGQSLATAMQNYPDVFSALVVNVIKIGESSGHLSESFGHIHQYLEFETSNIKQIKASFRYPIFVLISISLAIIVLNIFVIPTFSHFYTNLTANLPWQTKILIASSNFFVNYGLYCLVFLIGAAYMLHRYVQTPVGKYNWDKLQLQMPIFGKLLRRLYLIRFSQSLAIVLRSGISITQGLGLVKNLLQNSYVNTQITLTQEMIERGINFTVAISKVNLFSPLEAQILAVGEKNGELGPAMDYIANFHSHEIQFDLKRMNDVLGPLLIAAVSGLVLIIALGIYLPIWNMINLVK